MSRKTMDKDSAPSAKRIRRSIEQSAKPRKLSAIAAKRDKFIQAAAQESFIMNHPSLDSVEDVVAAAKKVFGKDKGMRWLGMPVEVLHYATPISLAETPAGRKQIFDALSNLLHGAW